MEQKIDSNTNGWILLSLGFILTIIVLIGVLVYMLVKSNDRPPVCFGDFGVKSNLGGPPLMSCGTNRKTACIYLNIHGVSGAINQCNILNEVCRAFTYDALFDSMTIVDPNSIYPNFTSDLYVRQ